MTEEGSFSQQALSRMGLQVTLNPCIRQHVAERIGPESPLVIFRIASREKDFRSAPADRLDGFTSELEPFDC